MRDISLGDLQKITSDVQTGILKTTTRHNATITKLDQARRRLYAAQAAFADIREQSKTEKAFVNLNARAPKMLSEITRWMNIHPQRVVTEVEFDRGDFAEWVETLTDQWGEPSSSRTTAERAIRTWFQEEFHVAVQCWLPIPLETNWDLAMGRTGKIYIGFLTNAERISTRLSAEKMLPF